MRADRSAGREPSRLSSALIEQLAARRRSRFPATISPTSRRSSISPRRRKRSLPDTFICVGGHSASFTAEAILEHGAGAIDCVLKGEGEAALPPLLAAIDGRRRPRRACRARSPRPARGRRRALSIRSTICCRRAICCAHRRKYFIGVLDPCASIEFSRGCPWDCSFCSAWTFYGRSYRLVSPERVVEDLRAIREPGVFIVDDVAFIQEQPRHRASARRSRRAGIKKHYYLETRGDVLLRNKEVFRFWKKLGLDYMFLGLEAIDEEGLKKYRKRVPLGRNFEALEFARSLGINVAINLIADPDWDHERFRDRARVVPGHARDRQHQRQHALSGHRELAHRGAPAATTRDYRLFDIQHAVLPTRLPLAEFYEELVTTQRAIYSKHLDWRDLRRRRRHRGAAAGARPDQLRQEPVQAEQRLPRRTAARRPCAAGRPTKSRCRRCRPTAPAAGRCALRPRAARPRRPRDRRRHRALRRRNPDGHLRVVSVFCNLDRHSGRRTVASPQSPEHRPAEYPPGIRRDAQIPGLTSEESRHSCPLGYYEAVHRWVPAVAGTTMMG